MYELKVLELETNNTELEIYKTNLFPYGETLYIIKSRNRFSHMCNTRFGNLVQALGIARTYKNAIIKYIEPSQSAFVKWINSSKGFKLND